MKLTMRKTTEAAAITDDRRAFERSVFQVSWEGLSCIQASLWSRGALLNGEIELLLNNYGTGDKRA